MPQIRPTAMPRDSSNSEYLRYFCELTIEWHARADRLGQRLMAGGLVNGSPDMGTIAKPAWELNDVCCLTTVTRDQLSEVLPPVFDAFRRFVRARRALSASESPVVVRGEWRPRRRPSRAERLERADAASGPDELIADYLAGTSLEQGINTEIHRWLTPMFEPCQWSAADHFGRVDLCRKPVDWTMADMDPAGPWGQTGLRSVPAGDAAGGVVADDDRVSPSRAFVVVSSC